MIDYIKQSEHMWNQTYFEEFSNINISVIQDYGLYNETKQALTRVNQNVVLEKSKQAQI